MTPIITLLSDFGTIDGFVGAMKGVILSLAPGCQLVDLTHEIPPQEIRAGAWALGEAVAMFPADTIHVAVVDPGVGTERHPLLLRTRDGQLLIGPDNGLLSLAASADSEAWRLDRRRWHRATISNTFHGRDIFASVAGHLAAGVSPEQCGTPTREWVRLPRPAPSHDGDRISGQVVHVDRFGNLVTNVQQDLIEGTTWEVVLNGRSLGALRSTFGDVSPGEWVAYIGSGGRVEIAVCEGKAAALGAARDSEVILCSR